MASTEARRECETEGCRRDAKLQCPTCIKLGIQGSYFCSQECFKGSWTSHKLLHKKAKEDKHQTEAQNCVEKDTNTDPWLGYRYTGKLRPHYPLTPMRPVPGDIQRPDYADHPRGMSESEQFLKGTSQIKILSPEDIEGMRVVCKLAREVLDIAAVMVKPGVTTEEIDHAVHLACVARKCYPSPLNYYNFPKSCCTSVNEVICHGIPDQRALQDGDILNVDITVYHNGFHGDLNETFFVGEVEEAAKRLVQTTYECLMQAIDSGRKPPRRRVSAVRLTPCGSAPHSEARRSLPGAGERHPETRAGQRLLRGAQLLRPRHPPPLPHGAQRPALRQKQSGWGHEAGSRVHHRAHDLRGRLAGRDVARRLDGGDPGREAVGPVRAHAAGDGDGLRGSDAPPGGRRPRSLPGPDVGAARTGAQDWTRPDARRRKLTHCSKETLN